jgi:Tfp pilus assembly protein PilN
VYSRSTPVAELSAETVAMEVERTILSCTGRIPGRSVDDVRLAASGEEAEELAESISRHLGRPVATCADANCGLELSSAAGVSVAAVRRPGEIPDLLHPPLMQKKFQLTRTHKIVGIVALALILILVVGQIVMGARAGALADLEEELRRSRPRTQEMLATMERTKLSRVWAEKRFPWVDLLLDVSEKLDHSRVVVLTFQVSEDGTLELSGKAKSKEAVNDAIVELSKSGFFRSVEFRGAEEKRDKTGYDVSFRIIGQVEGLQRLKK